ncbi:hypothetical protein QUA54_20250 [Microcoleus sp. MOSTC5]|uniref:hypothetical protein n=1 Tax=Microcoleus sp. MOSTC5 TaxID=3055378 RepID=UPI002FCF542F
MINAFASLFVRVGSISIAQFLFQFIEALNAKLSGLLRFFRGQDTPAEFHQT